MHSLLATIVFIDAYILLHETHHYNLKSLYCPLFIYVSAESKSLAEFFGNTVTRYKKYRKIKAIAEYRLHVGT